MTAKRWNGTAFNDVVTRKRWTGSAWVDLTVGKRWTGSAWVDLWPTTPPPAPGLPDAAWTGSVTRRDFYFCEPTNNNACPVLKTFTWVAAFTTTNSTSITVLPVTGVTGTVSGSSVTFTASVARDIDGEELVLYPAVQFTNSMGSVVLTLTWGITYLVADGGPQP